MAPIFWRMRLCARVFATLVACLFLAQTTIAATHFATLGEGVVFGAKCAPQDGANGGDPPAIPHSRHCHGICCILHGGALDAPALKPVASIALIFSTEAISLPPATSGAAPRIEPKGAPQSPRPPPQHG
ncbi:MAG: hypothetical protein U1E25_09380 [Methylocystis sp.]